MDTLGVAMIVRDEPVDRLAMLVEYLSPIVTEFSIVDTGSADVAIDGPLISSWPKVKFNHFTWVDDFAAARNYSLGFLNTDWVLHLDADETISHGMYDAIVRVLTECDPRTKGWLFMTQNYWAGERGIRVEAHWHCRLFRRASGNWYKKLHEQVMLDGRMEHVTRNTIALPKADESALLIHSKPRDRLASSEALYNRIGER